MKQGIVIRPGVSFEIIVPPEWETRVNVNWGSAATTHLFVPSCAAETGVEWLAFAGGYTVTQNACLPLIVRTAERDHRVWIAAGAGCPRHSPPRI